MRLVIASGNAHKVEEIVEILASAMPDLEVVGMNDLGSAPAVPETGDTFGANAVLKARGIATWLREQGYRGEGLVPEIPIDVRCEAARRYIEAYEQITDRAFVPDTEDPNTRIPRNLGLASGD